MLKKIEFVSIDFETTGLDLQKDEPIQVGIIKFNQNLEIKEKFVSYIKPKKEIKELKNIVKFITWLNLKDLEDAPSINEIKDNIKRFFNKNTIVVWHNINFDLWFLKRYIDDVEYLWIIDTFNLSQTFIHFAPSYALEIINEILKDKKEFKKLNLESDIERNYHDALYDSFICYKVFCYFLLKIKYLTEKYPILIHYIKKSKSIYSEILDIEEINKNKIFNTNNLFLPPLQKEKVNQQKLYEKNTINFDEFKNKSNLYIWNINIKKVISQIISNNSKVILAFSSRAKLNIAKNIIQELWIYNIGYFSEKTVFNQDNIKAFLDKDLYTEFEINFFLKYFDQFDNKNTLLDINNENEKKIYNFLKEKNINESSKENIILTTHWWFYNQVKKDEDIEEYQTFFFDQDWWYSSFSKFINKPYDIYCILKYIEQLIYKYNTLKNWLEKLDELKNYFEIFIGTIFSEITVFFRKVQNSRLEFNPIRDDVNFWKTNNLLEQLEDKINILKTKITEQEFNKIRLLKEELENFINNPIVIERKIYNNDKINYLFLSSNIVINYHEFDSYLDENNIFFLTNFNKERSKKISTQTWEKNDYKIQKIKNPINLSEEINWNYDSIFILSTSKSKSQEIFENIIKNNIQEEYAILIENITWWIGKNIFYAKKFDKKIIIWWYEFFMSIIWEKIKLDKLLVYNLQWPLEKIIINDMYYYNK